MRPSQSCLMIRSSLFLLLLLALGSMAFANTPASRFDENHPTIPAAIPNDQIPFTALGDKAVGDVVDFGAALQAGANYLRHAQADDTEDNAGNGTDGVDETPDDPDDGGWDWSMADPAFTHSTAASPTNIYGATAQGLYYAYLESGDPALLTAMTDAADAMIADPNIRSGGDMVFLMKLNSLPAVTGTAYQDAARAKYDGRITTYGSATALAEYIRDARSGQGYNNGIIAWDVGIYAVIARMLDGLYLGQGYDQDAIDVAEVLWQDSFGDNPGYFDVVDRQGFDPTFANKDYWWYTLGITGLIDAFNASGVGEHVDEIPGLMTILKACQYSSGAFSGSYGANPDDEDWQSTAYSVLTLAHLDQVTYQPEINVAAYWLAATQQAASGGWVYGSGNHYPEIGGECTAAVSFGVAPTDVVIDDDFIDQAAVDVYNLANGTSLVWGYTAFDNLQDGIDAVSGSTLTVLAGLYSGNLVITSPITLLGAQAGVDARGRVAAESILTTSSGNLLDIQAANVIIDGFHITGATGAGQLVRCESGGAGLQFLNNIVDGVAAQGMWFNTTAPGILIDQNDIDAVGMTNSYAIAHFDGSDVFDNLTISNNNLSNGWMFAGNKVYNTANMLITANLFDGAAFNFSSQFRNSTISDNIFRNNDYTNGQLGMLDGFITGNTFEATGPSPYAGTSSSSFQLYGNDYGLAPSQNVLVSDNIFYTNNTSAPDETAQGLRLRTGTISSTITVEYNQFLDQGGQGALAIYNQGVGVVPASCNWWSSVDGPNHLTNPSAGANVDDDVVFWPWLDGPAGACVMYGDNNVSATDPAACLTPGNTCVTVPVVFNRLDTSASRGVSVTFQLSPELVLCTPAMSADIVVATGAGSWSGTFGNFNYQLVDNGGGSYTVDQAILGTPCGPTTGGDLFSVKVAKAAGIAVDAVGTVTVTDVLVRDCDNVPLPGIPGPAASVTIDLTAPGALADLTAGQQKTGNDSDGTTEINLAWTAPGGDADFIDIWRKGFGDYPEYDDGTGAVPAAPITVANGWTLVATVAAATTAYVDEPALRDFYYYTAFVTDACGNISGAAAMTGGTLNYHLGDVKDIVNGTPGVGDNVVDTADISHLGFNYGITVAHGDPVNYLDVGPTTDYSVDARPTTDSKVQFEDLMMFAINYGVVSKIANQLSPLASNTLELSGQASEQVGSTFEVELQMTGNGLVQGLSVPLAWNDRVVQPVGMTVGDLMEQQGGLSLVVAPSVGTVDAALFGARDQGISGRGLLAKVQFKVIGLGDPEIAIGEITARDKDNAAVDVNGLSDSGFVPAAPTRSVLNNNVPNPFNPSTEFSFALSREGKVNLSVYTVRGRLVKTLLNEEMAAGPHSIQWNGTDMSGRMVSSGTYLVRMVAPDATQSRNITLLK